MLDVICPIGNSDVQFRQPIEINGEKCEKMIPKARQMGDFLFSHYEEYRQHLDFPIISKVLTHTCRQLEEKEKVRVHLVVSNQQDPQHNAQDTIFYGKILRRYLVDSKVSPWVRTVERVTLWEINENPADYDNMNRWFGARFRDLYSSNRGGDEVKKIVLGLAGGTPAMSSFALINGVNYLGDKLEVVYVSRTSNYPIQLRVGRDLLLANAKNQIQALMGAGDFHAAAEMVAGLERNVDHQEILQATVGLLRYAYARAAFDFELARVEIGKSIALVTGETRQTLLKLEDELALDTPSEDLMGELLTNAQLKVQQGDYIDFLGRVFRMQEEAYKLIAEKHAGARFDRDRKRLSQEWLGANPQLKAYLEAYQVSGNKLDYNKEVNRTVMEAVLAFYAPTDPTIQKAETLLKKVDDLANLRNRLPIAHGFQGVTRETIEKEYPDGIDKLLQDLRQIVEIIGCDPSLRETFPARVMQLGQKMLRELV